jgi:hypothetical protein
MPLNYEPHEVEANAMEIWVEHKLGPDQVLLNNEMDSLDSLGTYWACDPEKKLDHDAFYSQVKSRPFKPGTKTMIKARDRLADFLNEQAKAPYRVLAGLTDGKMVFSVYFSAAADLEAFMHTSMTRETGIKRVRRSDFSYVEGSIAKNLRTHFECVRGGKRFRHPELQAKHEQLADPGREEPRKTLYQMRTGQRFDV